MFSCKKPDRKEFIGKWESDDKAMIVLNKDSTCIVQNVDMEKIWGSYNDPAIVLNGNGHLFGLMEICTKIIYSQNQ
jgi:hypothetical protein